MRSQRVEGILLVIAAAPTPLNQLTRILNASIPMVCLDRIPDRVPVDSVSVEDVAAAVWRALELSETDDQVIVTGSLYVVGAARAVLAPESHQINPSR